MVDVSLDLKLGEQLEVIMSIPVTRNEYLRFLEAEFAVENLYFYEECLLFGREFQLGVDKRLLALRVKVIHESFVLPSASTCVNISSRVRDRLIDVYERSSSESDFDFPEDLYSSAKKEILNVMSQDTFLRFKETTTFKESALELNQSFSTISKYSKG
jgi:hypothetical protein